MDTEAYLKKHGWSGPGHALGLHSTGIKKPLLVSKKVGVLGVGINKHDVIADQWWMKAFDASLKDFGTGKKSLLGSVREHGVKRGGLYGRFVRGEGVPGTIGVVGVVAAAAAGAGAGAGAGPGGVEGPKRKADEEVGMEKSKKRKSGEKEKKKKKESKKQGGVETETESEEAEAARRAAKKEKKDRKSRKSASSTSTPAETSSADVTDTGSGASGSKEKKTKKRKDKSSSKDGETTLESLSEEKRQQYEERARAKGVTLEAYFAQRLVKNQEASRERASKRQRT